jgi:hypothetical protein
MYNRPMCGRSTGTYKNLGGLQRDLRGLSPTPPNKKKSAYTVEARERKQAPLQNLNSCSLSLTSEIRAGPNSKSRRSFYSVLELESLGAVSTAFLNWSSSIWGCEFVKLQRTRNCGDNVLCNCRMRSVQWTLLPRTGRYFYTWRCGCAWNCVTWWYGARCGCATRARYADQRRTAGKWVAYLVVVKVSPWFCSEMLLQARI